MEALNAAKRATARRFSPTVDDCIRRRSVGSDAPALAAPIPMMIGTCRTELSNQLGSGDPTTFSLTDADLTRRLAGFVPVDDVAELVSVVRGTSPGGTAVRGVLHDHYRSWLLARQRDPD